MIVYGSSLSPFVRKVLAFGAEKGIALESQPIPLRSEEPEFRAASPFAKIPALRDGDYLLADSSAIVHYLDALQPEPALIPAEPRARGRTIWWDEFMDTVLFSVGVKIFFNRVVSPRFLGQPGDLAAAENAEREELPPLLDYLERELAGREFLVGDAITLADIAVASPFANFRHAGLTLDSARFRLVTEYTARILARPSFTRWIESEERLMARTAA